MNFIVRVSRQSLTGYLRASFTSDKWKDRDQSAEKVFITQEQKKTLSSLLNKIESGSHNASAKDTLFQKGLHEILKKHGVSSAAFEAEVNNLHKNL